MRKLLILGSSFACSEIVDTAGKRGWYTIVTDNLPPENSPAKRAADEYWMISTADIEKLEEECRAHGIEAVFSGVSEFNLDRVLRLCQKLDLPCYIDEQAWNYARNKRLFKNKCIEKGVSVVEEYTFPDQDDEAAWSRIKYPVVIKPVDGCANAGLSICHNREELEEGYRIASAYNNGGEIILERYINGEETWNYYVIAENEVRYVYSGRVFRQPGYPTFLYSFGTSAVDGVEQYREQMDRQCTELLKDIGCRDGIAWIQCIRDKEGKYYALEMAHRMSADASGAMLEKSLGFNIVDWMLDTALGIRHTVDMLPQPIPRPYFGAMCVYYLFADHSGKIMRMEGFDKLDSDFFRVEPVKRDGEEIEQYHVIAKIAFHVRNTEEMCSVLEYLNRVIAVNDENGRDLVIRYSDYEAVRQGHRGLMREQKA